MTRHASAQLRALEQAQQEKAVSDAVDHLSSAYETFLKRFAKEHELASPADEGLGERLRESIRMNLMKPV